VHSFDQIWLAITPNCLVVRVCTSLWFEQRTSTVPTNTSGAQHDMHLRASGPREYKIAESMSLQMRQGTLHRHGWYVEHWSIAVSSDPVLDRSYSL